MKEKIKYLLGKVAWVVLGVLAFTLFVTGLQLLFGESSFSDLFSLNLMFMLGFIAFPFALFILLFLFGSPFILLNWLLHRHKDPEEGDGESNVCSDNYNYEYDNDWIYMQY